MFVFKLKIISFSSEQFFTKATFFVPDITCEIVKKITFLSDLFI